MGSAGYSARRRARRKAAKEPGGALEKGGPPARTGARGDDPSAQRRRDLEDAYIDMFMSNPMPAHAAQNPSFRQFVRDQARAMSDEALTAYVNLSSGADDDDDEAMSRDMDRVMGGMRSATARMDKNFR